MEEYFKKGYYLSKNCLPKKDIANLINTMRSVFKAPSDDDIINLFNKDFDKFYGAANICQWLIELFHLAVRCEIVSLIAKLGINTPVMNTRPLVSYSSKKLAKNDNYWKVPVHQDWPSTQGSLNGLTLWIPLVDVTQELGPLEISPGSHLMGKQEHIESYGVPVMKKIDWNFMPVPMEVGDVLAFSNFLVHRSGTNITEDKIRWSIHFRYDDVTEKTFIDRNYPHYRTDKRLPGLLQPDFPTKEMLLDYFSPKNI